MPHELTTEVIRLYVSETEGIFCYRDMWEHLDIKSDTGRTTLRKVMQRLVGEGLVERVTSKGDGWFRRILADAEEIDWQHADPSKILKVNYPYGVSDQTAFSFSEHVRAYPGNVQIVGGRTNQGKTCWLLNMLAVNLDNFHESVYMTNEMEAEELASRLSYFKWVSWVYSDNSPRFKAIKRYENWWDVISPDGLNIIDYLDPGESAYMVGPYIDKIKRKLRNGIAIIALQKGSLTIRTKTGIEHRATEYAVGGQFGEHRARLVIYIEEGYLLVKKCKSWNGQNPNGRKYKFSIIEHGSQFSDIRETFEDEVL